MFSNSIFLYVCLDENFVTTEKDCLMPVENSYEEGLDWSDAGEVCELLNGTLAAVEDDETMLKVITGKRMSSSSSTTVLPDYEEGSSHGWQQVLVDRNA